jgi:hypothetical protein
VTPGNDTWRTPDAANRAVGNLVRGHNGDIESPPAIACFKVMTAGLLISELSLELSEAGRESRTRHPRMLLMVAS